MYGAKKKLIGGKEYMVIGSTITRDGIRVVSKSYTTMQGVVTIKNGMVYHVNGGTTKDD